MSNSGIYLKILILAFVALPYIFSLILELLARCVDFILIRTITIEISEESGI